ncbi:Na(+)/H(+) antiporter subunit B [Chloroflexi bacterium TSY]|nr:Na(+)/H(+) antiporter subunit B [Chloroflexi bacterium TSY]
MTELYMRLLDRILTPILLLLAFWLLLRGHNQPGGGFIAGLVVAAAFELRILSRGDEVVRQNIGSFLQPMIGIGLMIALLSAAIGVLSGNFFYGTWWEIHAGPIHLDIGTPMTFDIGVFLVVLAVVTSFLLGLSREE